MHKKIKSHSILWDFSFTVLVAFLVLLVWMGGRIYEMESDHIVQRTAAQAMLLERTFTETVSYAQHVMHHLGERILEKPHNNDYIADVLRSFKIDQRDFLTWSPLSWVNATGTLVINRKQYHYYPNILHYDYIQKAMQVPWQQQLGQPVYGIVSEQWSIPSSLGVQDQTGRYLGAVMTGFTIEGLVQKLEKVVNNQNVSFALMDTDFVIIGQSRDKQIERLNRKILFRLEEVDLVKQPSGTLHQPSLFNIYEDFVAYHAIPGYPYVIITSYNQHGAEIEIWNKIGRIADEFIIIGLIIIATRLLLYRRVISPIIVLSKAVHAISQGKKEVELPYSRVSEISELTYHVQKVRNYTTQLAVTQQKLAEANRMVKSAMDYMAHELKTPLNQMLGFSELLQKQLSDSKETKEYEYVSYIHEAGLMQKKQIASFLKAANYGDGSMALDEEEVDLAELVQGRVQIVRKLADDFSVSIDVQIPRDLPMIHADEIRLGHAIINFLSNGIKYNRPGGALTVSAEIEESNGVSSLILRFKDTGMGVAPEHLDAIFFKYNRGDAEGRIGIEGTGIGLALTKEVIELHGGIVRVASVVGEGTTFEIVLPEERIVC